jgi:hypothetical protein
MSDSAIAKCIQALGAIGIKADAKHFDTSLIKEI